MMNLVDCKNAPRSAVIRAVNRERVSTEQEQYLLECVTGTRRFVASVVSGPGRSLYIPANGIGLPDSKMKGAGGLRRNSRSSLVFYSPQPDKSYSSGDTHTTLTPDLQFRHLRSRPKAENSLRMGGAEMEFRAQTRLHIEGIGFDGLCWGEFLDKNGAAEVDLNGYKTGFAVSEYDLRYVPLVRVLGYEVDERGLLSERLHHDVIDDDALERHFVLVGRVGTVKRKMALDAKLGRHSSTLANFLYGHDGDILVTDTDTVVDYNEIEGEARGSQFLRDAVSDLMKRIGELKFTGPSERVAIIITQVITDFLTNLFADSLSSQSVATVVEEFDVEGRIESVNRKGLQAGANLSGETYFKEMFPEFYRAIYKLILQSDLPDAFPIKRIDPEILYRRAQIFYTDGRI